MGNTRHLVNHLGKAKRSNVAHLLKNIATGGTSKKPSLLRVERRAAWCRFAVLTPWDPSSELMALMRTACHTFGASWQDLDGVWATWNEMKAQKVLPSRITLGCMVEALASNNDAEGWPMAQKWLVCFIRASSRSIPVENKPRIHQSDV